MAKKEEAVKTGDEDKDESECICRALAKLEALRAGLLGLALDPTTIALNIKKPSVKPTVEGLMYLIDRIDKDLSTALG